ncbi:uncharacterized protein HMPREF1541_10069 [Cyphellophora europaea CBS 101466]|uniref:Uncharacterized protein n=1 Tax=Cyphellophora europaea (strain CBS 101466) TaxID=1220924 RepID=W2S939_CYPE1|nr:uncharacterized protein HMPREF1541_10069 [Cyphellophora europaea CBS 101466]ETN45192.1 hypothetical protein HMPREF1541_10069 [Cyphellophora europaea CBS 101466]
MTDVPGAPGSEDSRFVTIHIERTHGKKSAGRRAFRDQSSKENKITKACLASMGFNPTSSPVNLKWSVGGWDWEHDFNIVDSADHEIVLGTDSLEEIPSGIPEAFPIFGRRMNKEEREKFEQWERESRARKEAEREARKKKAEAEAQAEAKAEAEAKKRQETAARGQKHRL